MTKHVTFANGAVGHPGRLEWSKKGKLRIPPEGVPLTLRDPNGPVVGHVLGARVEGDTVTIVAEVDDADLEAVLSEVGDRLISLATP
jgi:hypothetical protein